MNSKKIIIGAFIVILLVGGVVYYLAHKDKSMNTTQKQVTIKTNRGDVIVELFLNDAPKTAANFTKLAGEKFYDGLTFHRVISGFMIQGGDPNCSSGRGSGPCGAGGPGFQFEDELNPATPSYQTGYQRGVVAMANSGPNTNGSQFFIMHKDMSLPHKYTIFGKVVSGTDVVDSIASTPTDQNDRPKTPVVMEQVLVE